MKNQDNTERPQISVVVPVYNSEASLNPLVNRLHQTLQEAAQAYEIVLVNDGSGDRSWKVIRELSAADERVVGVNLMRNYGQHNALLCGFRFAKYPVLVTIDDDLQHPPEEIPRLISKLNEGCDVVYGTPGMERHGIFRDAASVITKIALQTAMGVEVARKVGAFRIIRKDVCSAFINHSGPFISIDVLLTWGTTSFASVEVRHDPREMGKSNYTLRKLIAHAVNMITGYSALPLQIATVTGFVFTLFGVGVLAFVLGRLVLQGVQVPGFAFLASIIAVFSGAQLFSLGIIGEYLARMHYRTMEKPPFVVRESTRTPALLARNQE